MNNVFPHPTVSWEKAKSAFDQIQRREGQLIAAWIELGTQLNLLRAKFPADQEFGAACQAHGIDLTHQHRKAAMWLAALDHDQLDSLRQYNPTAIHPKTLQDRCREQFPEWLTSTRAGLPSGETGTEEIPDPEISEETVPQAEESADATEQKDVIQKDDVKMPRIDARNILVRSLGKDIAEKVYSQWPNRQTIDCFNALVQSPGGKKAIKRMVSMIDEYSLAPNRNPFNRTNNKELSNSFSHRVFFPEIPGVWARYYGCTWQNVKAINAILDEIPDANRMMEELGTEATFEQCNHWWKRRDQNRASVVTETDLSAFAEVTESKEYMVKPASTGDSDEIMVHGKVIWPCESGLYSYEEAWAAYHFWEDENRYVASLGASTEDRARHWMTLNKWLQYCSHGFAKAWHTITTAQHNHPDLADETHAPATHRKLK